MVTKELKSRLKETMDRRGISFLELERQTGIKANRMYKWYQQDTNPKKEDSDLLEKWLNDLDKVPPEPAHETATTDKTMAAEPQKSLTEHALFLMAQSNNMMAEAMLLAEKNRSAITESNKDLTKTIVHLTTTTGSAQQESQQDVDAILTVVQELLLELGTGKSQWKSVDEGRAVWNRRIAAVLGLGSSEGTQTSLDKMRISK